MRWFNFFSVLIFLNCLFSCNGSCSFGTVKNDDKCLVSLVTWNLQTFFDGERDGTEYEDFRKSRSWNRESYAVRLGRLCECINSLDADVFVFQEMENEGILQDISNQLAGNSWSGKDLWKYSCFAKTEGSSIGIGVLSKYELADMTTHCLDLRGLKSEMPDLRPLVEVTVCADCGEFVVFANHWKSMTGGEEETELWREWQEAVLGACLLKLKAGKLPGIVCGDFNRDISGFCNKENTDRVLLRSFGGDEIGNVSVRALWLNENGVLVSDIGSYYFRERWERIDNIFTVGDVDVRYFAPVARSPWTVQGKIPFSYKISTGEGYSDHLPLMCKFKLK